MITKQLVIALILVSIVYYVDTNGLTSNLLKEPSVKLPDISVEAKEDERIKKVQVFLEKYNSPMAGSAHTFIEVADKYKMDYRLLPSIAGTESTFGKKTPSCAKFNAFGWTSTTSPCGFYRFTSFDDAIRLVGEKIATKNYYAKFRVSGKVEDLSIPYNNGSKDWVFSVKFFMNKI